MRFGEKWYSLLIMSRRQAQDRGRGADPENQILDYELLVTHSVKPHTRKIKL